MCFYSYQPPKGSFHSPLMVPELTRLMEYFAFLRRSFRSDHLTRPTPKSNKTLIIRALFLPGDIQANPSPRHQPVYQCGFCELAVSWSPSEEGVCCDVCSIWYHRSCFEMCTKDYSLLQRSNVQWLYCRCQTINISSFTFRSIEISPRFYEPITNENITPETLSPTFNHFSLAVSNQQTSKCQRPQQEDPTTHHARKLQNKLICI